MAHFLRRKLHTLCSSRLPSPALASKLLKSPGTSEASNLTKPKDHNSQHKNQQRYKDLSSKSKDNRFTKESEDSFRLYLDRASNNQARPLFSKLPQGSDDAVMSVKGSSSSISETTFLHDRPGKNEAREPSFKLPQGSDGKGTNSPSSREAAYQASSNSDGVSKQTYMVCIQNLPGSCNPSMVKASMAIHGEVTGFFKKPVRDRLSAYIQFKTAEAMESALASRKLQLGSKTCYITRSDQSVFTTVVRISKVGNDIDEGELRSVCELYGKVDDIRKRAYGVFDVFYDVKELTNIPSILSSLSEVHNNRSAWFAFSAPLVHPSMEKEVLKSPEGQSWHNIQVNHAINRVEAGLDVVSVLFEDLKQLSLVSREYSK
ncbi:hypothetical protein GOP47_0024668 [Adiantum capillus-veneris]|uniref:RRM domain-containing protein n=1 Tax=Adiantum capillus-veneris TaxID=13818 RepID=A0A9D4Z2W1_ADICA|nr:hypothetical protein GOP47_0024668 [Adiantum capillus-veneris]